MLKRDNAVLVLVDVQGKLAELMSGRDELFENLERLIKGGIILGLPILWNEQNPEKLGRTIPRLVSILEPVANPLKKMTFSCCGNRDFVTALEQTGRHDVILAGIETHVCVYQTARHLLETGFHVEVVGDAVSSRRPENKNLGLERIRHAGAQITGTEMVLFELLQSAAAPEFREIQKLLK